MHRRNLHKSSCLSCHLIDTSPTPAPHRAMTLFVLPGAHVAGRSSLTSCEPPVDSAAWEEHGARPPPAFSHGGAERRHGASDDVWHLGRASTDEWHSQLVFVSCNYRGISGSSDDSRGGRLCGVRRRHTVSSTWGEWDTAHWHVSKPIQGNCSVPIYPS